MRVLRKCAERCRGAGNRTTDAELRAELQVPGIPTLLRRERLRYVARSRPCGVTATQCSPAEAGVALIIEDLHALRARDGWKLSDLPEFSADPRPWNKLWTEFPEAWQTMVNAACARDFPAYSFGDSVTAVSTVQSWTICETIFQPEAAL